MCHSTTFDGASVPLQAAARSNMSVSRDAMPDPFRRLIVEQAIASSPQDRRCHDLLLGNPCDRVGRSRTPVHFAIGNPIQRQSETIVPFHPATERTSRFLYRGASKGRIENDGLDVLADVQRTVNMSLDIIVQPGIETRCVCFGQGDQRATTAKFCGSR